MANEINRRIAHYRKLANLNQSEVAEYIGMKTSTYSQRERKGIIDCEFLIKLADLFQVDIFTLLFSEEEANERRKLYEKTVIIEPEKKDPKPEFITHIKVEDFILTVSQRNHLSVVQNLNKEEQTAVFKYAYALFNKNL